MSIMPVDRREASEESALHRMGSAFSESMQRTAYENRPSEEVLVLEMVGLKYNCRNSSGRLRRQVRALPGETWPDDGTFWVTIERWGHEWVIVGPATTAADDSMLPGG